ncbi:MAG: hypothetical protein KC800_11195 [Candidatus Eremiobacteraeota bacterium]|nr:hypothetical protein [Candidatus Eremiobacteraeota bacterium]
MNYSDTFATAKASLLQELGRKRRWQTYVVAVGLTLCFFLVVGNVLGESSTEPVKTEIAKTEKAPEVEKVEGYQLADKETADSAWEVTTGVKEDAPAKEFETPKPDTVLESESIGPQAPSAETADDSAQTEPLGPEEAATQLTANFYSALNDGHLGEAYDKLSPDFQANLPFECFQSGYEVVDSISCEVKNSEVLPDDQVRLDLQIEATEAGYPSTYYATCIVSKVDDAWTISGVAQLAALDY